MTEIQKSVANASETSLNISRNDRNYTIITRENSKLNQLLVSQLLIKAEPFLGSSKDENITFTENDLFALAGIVNIQFRDVESTITLEPISEINSEPTDGISKFKNEEGDSIGGWLNKNETLKEQVKLGMTREIKFQMRNALLEFNKKEDLPYLSEEENGEIEKWIREGIFNWDELRDRLLKLNESDPLMGDQLRIKFIQENLRKIYVGKINNGRLGGAKNLDLDEVDKINIIGATSIAFPFWKNFPELLDQFVKPLAGSIFLVTSDNKIIFNIRSIKNGSWKLVPGAPAAGMIDNVNTQNNLFTIRTHLEKEGLEEDGLTPDDIEFFINGFVKTNASYSEKRPRLEFIGAGFVKLDKREIIERLRMASKSATNQTKHDFAETDVICVDADTQTIEKLVKLLCPWPTTHLMGLLNLGYHLKIEELRDKGMSERDLRIEASKWVRKQAEMANIVYDLIDRIVNVGSGYNADLTPRQQGLPDVEESLNEAQVIHERLQL